MYESEVYTIPRFRPPSKAGTSFEELAKLY